jgi:hypothetical protein
MKVSKQATRTARRRRREPDADEEGQSVSQNNSVTTTTIMLLVGWDKCFLLLQQQHGKTKILRFITTPIVYAESQRRSASIPLTDIRRSRF